MVSIKFMQTCLNILYIVLLILRVHNDSFKYIGTSYFYHINILIYFDFNIFVFIMLSSLYNQKESFQKFAL